MTTQINKQFIALAAALGLLVSTLVLAPAAIAHDDGSSGQGCHSHEGSQHGEGSDQMHCH